MVRKFWEQKSKGDFFGNGKGDIQEVGNEKDPKRDLEDFWNGAYRKRSGSGVGRNYGLLLNQWKMGREFGKFGKRKWSSFPFSLGGSGKGKLRPIERERKSIINGEENLGKGRFL